MKILFIGDYSNYHATLAHTLARRGHHVTVCSNGNGWMQTARSISLSRPLPGKAGGMLLWLKMKALSNRLSGYDVVQLCGPVFLDLRPHRIYPIFNRLKQRNGIICLTAMSTDSHYVAMCTANDTPLRYSDFRIGSRPSPWAAASAHIERAWLGNELMDHTSRIYNGIDGAISALYEYHLALQRVLPAERIAYGGIPIDTASMPLNTHAADSPINIFLGRHRTRIIEKGTDILESAAHQAVSQSNGCATLTIVENRPYAEYIHLLGQGDILLDQLYSYTPATNALLGMARGMTAVSGAEPEYYNFIGEHSSYPIVNAIPGHIEELTEHLLALIKTGRNDAIANANRQFVLRHNDADVVADRYEQFWNTLLINTR
ncbi:MAG: hypothetical protein K2M76_02380 [Muribaculaceae bacterium]|nr:hypothetical protein [Muribaculaceae bacterium]